MRNTTWSSGNGGAETGDAGVPTSSKDSNRFFVSLQVLTMEIVGLLLELKKSSVVPYKKRLAEHFQKILNTVRKDLPA